jgi:hypothetical protein
MGAIRRTRLPQNMNLAADGLHLPIPGSAPRVRPRSAPGAHAARRPGSPSTPVAHLSLVVPLPDRAGDELHALGDLAPRPGAHQEMNVIAGDDVVEDAEPGALACFVQPPHSRPAIPGELQKKQLAMTALGDVPDVAGKAMTISAWHDSFLLIQPISAQKRGF